MLMDGNGTKYHIRNDKQTKIGKTIRSHDSYMHCSKKNSKKPAQQLYRPPGVRDQDSGKSDNEALSFNSVKTNSHGEDHKSTKMTISNSEDSHDSKYMHEAGDSKYKLKKPDMAIYVPPQRMNILKDGDAVVSSDKICDKVEDSSKLNSERVTIDKYFNNAIKDSSDFPQSNPSVSKDALDKQRIKNKSDKKSTKTDFVMQSLNTDNHLSGEILHRNYVKKGRTSKDSHQPRKNAENLVEERKTHDIPSLLSLVIENPPLCQKDKTSVLSESTKGGHVNDGNIKVKMKKDKFLKKAGNSQDKRSKNNQESEIHKDEVSVKATSVVRSSNSRTEAPTFLKDSFPQLSKTKGERSPSSDFTDGGVIKVSKLSSKCDGKSDENSTKPTGIIPMPHFNWADDDDDDESNEIVNVSVHTIESSKEREPINSDQKKSKKRNSRTRMSSSCSDAQSDEGTRTKGGILILKSSTTSDSQCHSPPQLSHSDHLGMNDRTSHRYKQLYDPKNPKKPEVVQGLSVRDQFHPKERRNCQFDYPGVPVTSLPQDTYPGHHYGYPCSGFENYPLPPFPHPAMYNGQIPPMFCQSKKIPPGLMYWLNRGECDIMGLLMSGNYMMEWDKLNEIRSLMKCWFQQVLVHDLEFCETQNVEQVLWKCLYYQLIELLRKSLSDTKEAKEKQTLEDLLTQVLDDGAQYFEKLLEALQDSNRFKLSDYLEVEGAAKPRGSVRFAVISAQKIFLYLGDLARYKGLLGDDLTSYTKARSWYCKAQKLNPKNGRPYNQLAIISLYNRKKLDAVYYYMRSLMSSNPFQSAKESLLSLFHETTKKWESNMQKPEKEISKPGSTNKDREKVRREIWIRPDDGNREQRTTCTTSCRNSQDNSLLELTSGEINKRFILSFLHVHSKLYSKINMETFTEAGVQMLKEFRALLNFTPVAVTGARLLQLLALNMFSIETHHLKDSTTRLDDGKYRSPYQENAMNISLEMFSLLLEKCNVLLSERQGNTDLQTIGDDLEILLSGVKIWCDWLISHPLVWNPPPSSTEFKVGPLSDPWERFAQLINLLSEWDYKAITWSNQDREDYYPVRLVEDETFAGFTPLMACTLDPFYVPKGVNSDLAKNCIRVEKIMFCGREYLCGVEPPILKYVRDKDVYISIVQFPESTCHPVDKPQELELTEKDRDLNTLCLPSEPMSPDSTPSEILQLRHRKEELERHHQNQEKHRQKVQAILDGTATVEMEIRPRYLVPDTNCFIDYLEDVLKLCDVGSYIVLVPLVVLNELDGLARGKSSRYATQEHAVKVAQGARQALSKLRHDKHPRIRFVTSRGTVMASSTFTTEEDSEMTERNDDRILSCCIEFHKEKYTEETSDSKETRHLYREVVLLTDDRNLRVKALTADVPVRELPDFIHWSGVG